MKAASLSNPSLLISVERGPAPVTGCTWLGNSCVSNELPTIRTDSLDFALSVTNDIDVGTAWAVIKPMVLGCTGSLEAASLGWSSLSSSLSSPALSETVNSYTPSSVFDVMMERREIETRPWSTSPKNTVNINKKDDSNNSWWQTFSRGLGESQWGDSDRIAHDWLDATATSLMNPRVSHPSGAHTPSPSHPTEVGFAWLEGSRVTVWAPEKSPRITGETGEAIACLYPRATAVAGIPIAKLSVPKSLFPGDSPASSMEKPRIFPPIATLTRHSVEDGVLSTLLTVPPASARPDLFDEYFAPALHRGGHSANKNVDSAPIHALANALLPLALLSIMVCVIASLAHISDYERELRSSSTENEMSPTTPSQRDTENKQDLDLPLYDQLVSSIESYIHQIFTAASSINEQHIAEISQGVQKVSHALHVKLANKIGRPFNNPQNRNNDDENIPLKTVENGKAPGFFLDLSTNASSVGNGTNKKNYCESKALDASPPAFEEEPFAHAPSTFFANVRAGISNFNLMDDDTASLESYVTRGSWAQTASLMNGSVRTFGRRDTTGENIGNLNKKKSKKWVDEGVEVPIINNNEKNNNKSSVLASNQEEAGSDDPVPLQLFAALTPEQQRQLLQLAYSAHDEGQC